MTTPPHPRTISGPHFDLHFTDKDDDLHKEYEAKLQVLVMEIYTKLRNRNGVYASNQGKYVPSVDDLKPWDSRNMENQYNSYWEGE